MLEVTDMEDRNSKLDVRIVSDAIDRIHAAGFAEGTFVGCTLHQTPT